MSNSTLFMMPSGGFVATQGYQMGQTSPESASIWNPALADQFRQSYKFTAYEQLWDSVGKCLSIEYPKVSQADFDQYGETLVTLAQDVAGADSHLNLGPLRGAGRPCAIVEVMNRGQIEYDFFNFSNHTHPKRKVPILGALSTIIRQRDPEEENFRIQITDTAMGGHGTQELAALLSQIKNSVARYKHQEWSVVFNLLHDERPKSDVARMMEVEKWSQKGIIFNVQRHCVSSLITEDYDEWLGLEYKGDQLKVCSQPGEFLLLRNSEVFLVASEDLKVTFDDLFTTAVTEGLVTSPYFTQVADIWGQQRLK